MPSKLDIFLVIWPIQGPSAPESELNDKFHVVIRFSIDMPVPQSLIPAAEW